MHCHTQQNVTANRVNFNVILRIRHVGNVMCHVCDSCNFNCITLVVSLFVSLFLVIFLQYIIYNFANISLLTSSYKWRIMHYYVYAVCTLWKQNSIMGVSVTRWDITVWNMLLLSCFRTAITHLAVKLRIRHVCTWRAQCLTCLYVVLINSFFLLSHSHSLSLPLVSRFACLRLWLAFVCLVICSRHAQTHLLLVFPFWARFCCLRLQLDELFSKINPWQATKCNYTGALRSSSHLATVCLRLHINYCQQAANCYPPHSLAHCKRAPSSARVLSPSAAAGSICQLACGFC